MFTLHYKLYQLELSECNGSRLTRTLIINYPELRLSENKHEHYKLLNITYCHKHYSAQTYFDTTTTVVFSQNFHTYHHNKRISNSQCGSQVTCSLTAIARNLNTKKPTYSNNAAIYCRVSVRWLHARNHTLHSIVVTSRYASKI